MNNRELAASTIGRRVEPRIQYSKCRSQESRNRSNGETASISSSNLKLKNTLRQKLPKVKSFFSNINNRRVNKETSNGSTSKATSLLKSPPSVTIPDEYENSAAIPFSHIFVDDSDEGMNDSNKGSTSSINTFDGLSLAKMKGLKHSSTLPPMSEHQKKSFLRDMKKSKYAGVHNNKSKHEELNIKRNPSKLESVLEDENRPNAVFEVLNQSIQLRKNTADQENKSAPPDTSNSNKKSQFYFGDYDEDDDETKLDGTGNVERFTGYQPSSLKSSGSSINFFQTGTFHRADQCLNSSNSKGLKNCRKSTLNRICEKFKRLKHQDSFESSVSGSDSDRWSQKNKSSSTSNKRYNNLYVALYNFDAHESDDLSLRSGDFIRVRSMKNESWWLGERGKKMGYFPSNYVMSRQPNEKAFICNKAIEVNCNDNNSWLLKKNQVVLVDSSHYKSHKHSELFVRALSTEGFVPSVYLTYVEQ